MANRPVTATDGHRRAATVAMLFEAGKVVLHGRFPVLEAELLGMIAGGKYEGAGPVPRPRRRYGVAADGANAGDGAGGAENSGAVNARFRPNADI